MVVMKCLLHSEASVRDNPAPPAAAARPACPTRRNVARREMERLRTALNWELAPVIADFSPAFNAEAPTIFDKASRGGPACPSWPGPVAAAAGSKAAAN